MPPRKTSAVAGSARASSASGDSSRSASNTGRGFCSTITARSHQARCESWSDFGGRHASERYARAGVAASRPSQSISTIVRSASRTSSSPSGSWPRTQPVRISSSAP